MTKQGINKRTHIVLPTDLVAEIDRRVGKRSRSRFLAQLAARELRRLRQLEALRNAIGCWKDQDHPDLEQGSAEWVEQFRQEDERRFRELMER